MNIESLYDKCKENANRHQMYYHYTNLEALLYILSSQSFRLSLISLVNDIEEEARFDDIKKNKVFLACFSHHSEESIPLWKMYSQDKYGLRLGFSSINFFEEKNRYYYYAGQKQERLPCKLWEIRDALILDVEYVDDPYKHVNYFDPLDTGAQVPYPINLAIIKRKAWDYEAETRARVYIDVVRGVSSRLIESKSFECRNPSIRYIYCELKKEELCQLSITFNPFMSKELKDLVKNTVLSYIPNYDLKNFQDSKLENKIRA